MSTLLQHLDLQVLAQTGRLKHNFAHIESYQHQLALRHTPHPVCPQTVQEQLSPFGTEDPQTLMGWLSPLQVEHTQTVLPQSWLG